nr:hypothetical protein Cplu_467 [Cedratvirus plubellavi]
MDAPDYLFSTIFAHQGVLAGSFVRDCIVRHVPVCKERGIDILVPFTKVRRLVAALKKMGGEVEEVDYDKQDRVARYVIMIDGWLLDISCEYLFPPDTDVNLLCWNYHGYSLWYKIPDDWSYGHSMDLTAIVRRCKNKEAIALVDEWEDKKTLYGRIMKMAIKGWIVY